MDMIAKAKALAKHTESLAATKHWGVDDQDVLEWLVNEVQKLKICSEELRLLLKLAETSSDMVKARDWEEFRGACGGQEQLNKAHADALREYEQWLSEGEV